MGSRGKFLFDLNEPPVDDEVEVADEDLGYLQPQKAIPSVPPSTSSLVTSTAGPSTIANNRAFYHASSVSGFQPFVRPKNLGTSTCSAEAKLSEEANVSPAPASQFVNVGDVKPEPPAEIRSADGQGAEKEEGEWSDAEGVPDAAASVNVLKQSLSCNDKATQETGVDTLRGNRSLDEEKSNALSALDSGPQDLKSSNNNLEGITKGDVAVDGQEEQSSVRKQREVKGVEASHALRFANNLGNKNKLDHQKEAMLGKKRNRQTMFLKLEDVKQAGPLKSSTPRRQNFPSPVVTRIVKQNQNASSGSEVNGEKLSQPPTKVQKLADRTGDESSTNVDSSDSITECDGGSNSGLSTRHKRQNSAGDLLQEVQPPPLPRQVSLKHPSDAKQPKNSQVSSKKTSISQSSVDNKLGHKKLPPKKPITSNLLYQDTSVERLIREVTNNNFWHHPEETEFQRVPGQFESVEEYIRVFEPLLFEECRAQLYNTWEESMETSSRDTHPMVRIKTIEKRERGWYDVIVLPVNDCKWFFKEGDMAVLSTPRPGSVRSKRSSSYSQDTDEEMEVSGRVVGTVRRHIPIDTRDPLGATLHFYVGDSYDSSSKVDKDHILNKLQPKGIWYLTVLGSLATTQREYVALHAFRRLHTQMQTAILQPSPEHFPKYEEQPPGMPECFTANFVDHLHRTFNGPQLAAIQWAAMHTAAGTTGGTTKRQDPWPFTLVQGPPGTGKTHTVWGMLNVIHLVQYQHYYTALLKKLAPESYKQPSESGSENAASGSIDAVLQSMDQNLFRTLPKLCPKPRMLVCAPSNAATDELLSRVLDRGFIDGEMKVYRPDVARVGVDSQTRAAQAVSVERRTEQLLVKTREEVYGWMQQLRNRETQLSQQIACLQRELNVSAAAGRSQGSVGVDPEVLLARDQNRDTLLQNLAAAVEARDKNLVEMSRLLMLEGRFRAGCNFNMEEARANLEPKPVKRLFFLRFRLVQLGVFLLGILNSFRQQLSARPLGHYYIVEVCLKGFSKQAAQPCYSLYSTGCTHKYVIFPLAISTRVVLLTVRALLIYRKRNTTRTDY
uniref:DNA2/NAM7 helicase helicase domain-containing protein n=1 Tax=Kalanchoe fedtschenkoi TaxID=63787 RepID=A0A7N0R8G7_KALFE